MNKKKYLISVAFLIACIAILVLAITFLSKDHDEYSDSSPVPEDIPEQIPVVTLYGIPVDSFAIKEGLIRRNEMLATLLNTFRLETKKINQLGIASRDVFDVRKIRAGNPYSAFLTQDSTPQLQYFVYQHSPREYVVFDFRDSVLVSLGEKPIDSIRKTYSDTVRTSLWVSMKENKTNPLLALELSDMYAWTVDFFMIDKNDVVTVMYDELFVDDESVGIGRIHGAFFTHRKDDIYAIPFTQDSVETYFEPDGASLRREFLKAPLRFRRISSGFTHRRRHPILGIYRPHTGIDYAAPTGTPVHAIGDGIILKKGYNRASGNYIKIRHNSVYTTSYCHFSRFGEGMYKGARVRQGQVIGYVGTTGYATGPHLDFRMWKNGTAINPLTIDAPPAEPIKEENQAAFDSVQAIVVQELNELRKKASQKKSAEKINHATSPFIDKKNK